MISSISASGFVTPRDVWSSWSTEPGVLAPLVVMAVLYARGFVKMRSRGSRGASWTRLACFSGGLAALLVALVSPLDAMSDALFSAHMVQHLVLIVVVPPLLIAGRTLSTSMVGLPSRVRLTAGRIRRRLLPLKRLAYRKAVAWTLFAIALWGWHLPGPYQAAVREWPLHAIEHLCFLATSSIVWWIALDERSRTAAGTLERALFLVASSLQSAILGAVLLFASRPLYPVHGIGPSLWGLTSLQDQQLAGALMWIPPSAVYLIAAAVLLVRWFHSLEAPPSDLEPAPNPRGTVAEVTR
jgi:putative membrane protein